MAEQKDSPKVSREKKRNQEPIKESFFYKPNDPTIVSGLPDSDYKDCSAKVPPIPFTNKFSPKELAIIEKFKIEVKDSIPPPSDDLYYGTDFFYARWLVARDWDIPASTTMFINAMKWRKENNVSTIVERFEKTEYFKMLTEYWPSTIRNETNYWTYDNSVVFYGKLGTIDTSILDVIPIETIIEYHTYLVELLERKHTMIVRRYGYTKGNIMIEDLSNLTMAVLGLKLQDLIKKITYINENYYPLTLRRIHIINAPLVFNAIWAVVKNFF